METLLGSSEISVPATSMEDDVQAAEIGWETQATRGQLRKLEGCAGASKFCELPRAEVQLTSFDPTTTRCLEYVTEDFRHL